MEKKFDLQNCARCDWPYEAVILSPMHGSLVKGAVCGICAREMRKAIHGVDIPFTHGSQAEYNEQMAHEWRERHPEMKPKEV